MATMPLMPSLDELETLANQMTYHRAKAEAMGFKFTRVTVEDFPMAGDASVRLRCVFSCVCGRIEEFSSTFPRFVGGSLLRHRMDVARELWQHGSFSRDHLIADGYTELQCDDIEAKAQAFDDECIRYVSALQDREHEMRMNQNIRRAR